MKKIALIVCAATIAGAGALAMAHSDATHSQKSTVKKEQQPWGIAGDAKAVTRSVTLSMSDAMRFSPDQLEVKQGDTIRFVVKNDGQTLHEMVIGTRKNLDDHAAMMVKFPNMEHDEPHMTHVSPGKTGEIIWTFNRAGTFDYACLIAGHYQAGMVGKVTVLASR